MRRVLALAAAMTMISVLAAVVIVSGGDATTSCTGPDQACKTGLAAGNTDTALREYLLSKGYAVYTSSAMADRGQVVDDTNREGCPA